MKNIIEIADKTGNITVDLLYLYEIIIKDDSNKPSTKLVTLEVFK